MRRIVIVSILLAGCSGPSLSEKQKTQVHDIAGDVAGDVAVDMIDDSSRISDLESRIEDLEAKDAYN